MPNVIVEFTMRDGRTLSCQYAYHVTPGNTTGLPENCCPDEVDIGEPTFYIDDVNVDFKKLPKGLNIIANRMLEVEETTSEFTYTEEPFDDGMDDFDDYYDSDL